MSDRNFLASTILRRLGGLGVELGILAFCILIIMGTGQTEGPVFDAVGPDLFPSSLAIIVGSLTIIQILTALRGADDMPALSRTSNRPKLRNTAFFMIVVAIYVAVLARGLAPFYLATSAFMACTTPLLSDKLNWRDAVVGATIGLVLGGILHFVFTQILVIDLSN